MKPDLNCFPNSYQDSRDRFVAAVEQLGWDLASYPFSAKGPAGAQLSLEVASTPASDAQPSLVLSSGLHGIEGFLGAAVQLQHLTYWAERTPPSGVRLVLLHGLNPYGYAWLRRSDEQNRDPNRSFLLPGDALSESNSKLYAQLDSFLNPKSPPPTWEPFVARALWRILKYGYGPVQNAIAGGQYEFPQGLFYGGAGTSELQDILAKGLPSWLVGSPRVVHLDFHTGLGKWSRLMLLLDSSPTAGQRQDIDHWYDAGSYREPHQDQHVYQASGSFGRWCVATAAIRDYLFAVAEFGTYHPVHMLRALRAENREHHWGRQKELGDAGTVRSDTRPPHTLPKAKAELLEAFCPRSTTWRRKVLSQAFELIERTVQGLTISPINCESHPGG